MDFHVDNFENLSLIVSYFGQRKDISTVHESINGVVTESS